MRKSSNPPEEMARAPPDGKPEGTITADGANSPRGGVNTILVKDPEADDSALQQIKDMELPGDRQDNQEQKELGIDAKGKAGALSPLADPDHEAAQMKSQLALP